uniref:Uncharacterized protein n=1 Tax=Plectus sambesii TaxID=2011161 RepID=A0A914WA06_9BILA
MNAVLIVIFFIFLLPKLLAAHYFRDSDDSRRVPVAAEKCCSLAAEECCSRALRSGEPLRCDEIPEHRVAETIGCLGTMLFGSTPVNVTLLPCCDAYRDNEACFKTCVYVFTAPSLPPKRKLAFRHHCRSTASRATQCFNRCILWKMRKSEPFTHSEHVACTDEEEDKIYFGEELGF